MFNLYIKLKFPITSILNILVDWARIIDMIKGKKKMQQKKNVKKCSSNIFNGAVNFSLDNSLYI